MNKIQRLLSVCMALSVAAMLLPGTQVVAQELPVVKVGALQSIAASPVVVALKKGYFEEAGVAVEIVPFKNTAAMVAPLSAGQIDIASGAPTLGFYNAKLRGLKMKLVADQGRNSVGHGFNAVVVRKELYDDGKVTSLKDFAGLRVGSVSRNSPLDIQLDLGLAEHGLAIDDVQLEVMSFPNMLAALANGNIDAAVLVEPFVVRAEQEGIAKRIIGADEISPDFQISGIIFGEYFMQDKADSTSRWLEGYVRGIRFYLDAIKTEEGKDELFSLISEYARLKDRSLLDGVVFPGFHRDAYFNTDTVELTMNWYQERGMLDERPKMADMVDNSFLNEALDRIGRTGKRIDVE